MRTVEFPKDSSQVSRFPHSKIRIEVTDSILFLVHVQLGIELMHEFTWTLSLKPDSLLL